MMKKITQILLSQLICTSCFIFSGTVAAETYNLPSENESVIGQVQYTTPAPGELSAEVAQKYNLGQNALLAANPDMENNGRLPEGSLLVPTQFLLPPGPRKGIVVNLPEMRIYYYPKGSDKVMTFPIGIGKIGKTIPITNTKITRKVVNPTWTPPKDIRDFNREQGIELPHKMGPGPDNPLGPYAVYTGIPTYLIHSTIFPESIGTRASFGCLRMNEDDIKQFFPVVEPGTPIEIIDMPNKIAWQGDHLYLESHPPLDERKSVDYAKLPGIVSNIQSRLPKDNSVFVNWQMVAYLADNPDGIPHDVGVKVQ